MEYRTSNVCPLCVLAREPSDPLFFFLPDPTNDALFALDEVQMDEHVRPETHPQKSPCHYVTVVGDADVLFRGYFSDLFLWVKPRPV